MEVTLATRFKSVAAPTAIDHFRVAGNPVQLCFPQLDLIRGENGPVEFDGG
jgi:hypothetical protein